jgi:hypothetical protein
VMKLRYPLPIVHVPPPEPPASGAAPQPPAPQAD